MRTALIGESVHHRAELAEALPPSFTFATFPADAAHSSEYDDELADCDVVVSLRLRRERGYQFPPVPLLQAPGAGTDGIDQGCLAPSTWLCNVYEHEIPVAEFVLASILDWEMRRGELLQRMAVEPWPALYRDRPLHGEAYRKRLVLVGYGRVGRAVAARAEAFGMELVALDARRALDDPAYVRSPADLKDALAWADYVVVTCPLNESTRGLIGVDELAAMGKHAVIINVARGPIIDEGALYDALSREAIGGAVLDVWYDYPRGSDDVVEPSRYPLASLPNVWASPHASAWTGQLLQRRYGFIADNIRRIAEKRSLLNVVKPGAELTSDADVGEGGRR